MKHGPLDSREFFKLLRRRNGRNAASLDALIRSRSEREVAVLASDSSGFTRRTHEHGILSFLSLMTACYDEIAPLLAKQQGTLVLRAADNLLATFPDSARAVRAAVAIQKHLKRRNARRPEAERFHLCIGIESGPVIVLEDNVYGACVNVACKIGEDLASKGEILVSGGVAKAVKRRQRCSYARSEQIGGKPFELYLVKY
jgi:class 3 adenylate cyclase